MPPKPGQRYWLTISTANGVAFQAPQHYVVCTLALILAKIKVGFTGKTIGLLQIFVNPLLTAPGGTSGTLFAINSTYFHERHVSKIKTSASSIHSFKNCVNPLRVQLTYKCSYVTSIRKIVYQFSTKNFAAIKIINRFSFL